MDLVLLGRVLGLRRALRRRERWDRRALDLHRERALLALRAHAYQRSAFYRRFHRGFEHAPLEELPVLDKPQMMGSFDDLVTDPDVRLSGALAHLRSLTGTERYLGRYRVTRTAGTTGEPAVLLADGREWAAVVASYERAHRWAGMRAGPGRRTRLAVVSTWTPWHQSAQVGMSVHSPLVPVRRFDARQPIQEIVEGLNHWQPESLIAYASMARRLADEQLAGRLRISPRAVMCASEVLEREARDRIEGAWGREPFDVYGASEAAGIASECGRHRMHLYEDLVIAEIVDEANRPVPPGRFGAKLLVTVLFNRTQPLIRYALSDSVMASSERCGCGLSFALVAGIQGRSEEFLRLPGGAGGEAMVHPNVFHDLLGPLPLAAWQVVQEPGALRILLAGAPDGFDEARLRSDLAEALRSAGAQVPAIRLERVPSIDRTALGKAPLIRALATSRP